MRLVFGAVAVGLVDVSKIVVVIAAEGRPLLIVEVEVEEADSAIANEVDVGSRRVLGLKAKERGVPRATSGMHSKRLMMAASSPARTLSLRLWQAR